MLGAGVVLVDPEPRGVKTDAPRRVVDNFTRNFTRNQRRQGRDRSAHGVPECHVALREERTKGNGIML